MRTKLATIGLLALLLAGCSGDDPQPAGSTTTSLQLDLVVTSGVLGEYLSTNLGQTVYIFLDDAAGDPTCDASCAATWPPVTGDVGRHSGVKADLLGTVGRPDGSSQATYGGWPLYTYTGDDDAGEFNGQGVGDVWFVVDPDGSPVLPPPRD